MGDEIIYACAPNMGYGKRIRDEYWLVGKGRGISPINVQYGEQTITGKYTMKTTIMNGPG